MFGNSRRVESTQTEPHPRLAEIVIRHRGSLWLKPVAAFSLKVWDNLVLWRNPERPLILDLCCGRGESSHALKTLFPECQILGIDKSSERLKDREIITPDLALVRGDLSDLIPMMFINSWKAEKIYMLYPNPWPKLAQALRRWHLHPIFPKLVALGPIEMRTNWKVYAIEWMKAMEILDCSTSMGESDKAFEPTTNFEKKYLASVQIIYVVNGRNKLSKVESH